MFLLLLGAGTMVARDRTTTLLWPLVRLYATLHGRRGLSDEQFAKYTVRRLSGEALAITLVALVGVSVLRLSLEPDGRPPLWIVMALPVLFAWWAVPVAVSVVVYGRFAFEHREVLAPWQSDVVHDVPRHGRIAGPDGRWPGERAALRRRT